MTQDRIDPVAVAIVAAVVVLALLGMLAGWRRRGRIQASLELPGGVVAGGARVVVRGQYLATTFAGHPLERVVAGGLAHRSRAELTVTDDGIRLARDGAPPLAIPAAVLTGAGTATWTIDRAVEPGGLTVVGWSLRRDGDEVPVESAFRLDGADRDALVDAVQALVPVRSNHADP